MGHAEHNNVVVVDQRDRDGRVSGRWGHTTDGKPPLGYAAAFPRWAVFFAVCRSPGFMIVPGRIVL